MIIATQIMFFFKFDNRCLNFKLKQNIIIYILYSILIYYSLDGNNKYGYNIMKLNTSSMPMTLCNKLGVVLYYVSRKNCFILVTIFFVNLNNNLKINIYLYVFRIMMTQWKMVCQLNVTEKLAKNVILKMKN